MKLTGGNREFAPIKVITGNLVEQVNFKSLLEINLVNYRKDRLLVKRIKKIFADGIKFSDLKEEVQVRKDAY
jgi:hypothetical protein